MTEKNIILLSRAVSMVFTPFYLPLVGMIILFFFTYMSELNLGYRLSILGMVYLFTILLPTFLIRLYRKHQGWNLFELGKQERRMVPYIISILCYSACFYVMSVRNVASFMGRIVIAALVIQVLCAIINVWWKISTHTAAIGGVVGALMAFSVLFYFNPVWWLCLVFFVAGLVGTSRMILLQHSLLQVVSGFGVGLVSAFLIIL
jgi:PAP2 superfamily domain protein